MLHLSVQCPGCFFRKGTEAAVYEPALPDAFFFGSRVVQDRGHAGQIGKKRSHRQLQTSKAPEPRAKQAQVLSVFVYLPGKISVAWS